MGTGRQLHVGSIVTSSNSELLEEKTNHVGFTSKQFVRVKTG